MSDPENGPVDSSRRADSPSPPSSAGRRALLVALPSIVSLHPGVAGAVANSSIVLPFAEDGTCAAPPLGAEEIYKGWAFETKPEVVEFVPNGTYYSTPEGGTPVSLNEMCSTPGDYYFAESGDTPDKVITVPQGSHTVSFLSAAGSLTFQPIRSRDIL